MLENPNMSDPEIVTGNTALRGKEAIRAAGWALPFVLLINAVRPWAIAAGIGTSILLLAYRLLVWWLGLSA